MLEWIRIILEHSPLLALFASSDLATRWARSRSADSRSASEPCCSPARRWSHRAQRDTTGARQRDRPGHVPVWLGIQYGAQFFAGLRGPGVKWNLIGAIGVVAALGLPWRLARRSARPCTLDRALRRFDDVHARAAGSHRRRRQSRSGDRLFHRVSLGVVVRSSASTLSPLVQTAGHADGRSSPSLEVTPTA